MATMQRADAHLMVEARRIRTEVKPHTQKTAPQLHLKLTLLQLHLTILHHRRRLHDHRCLRHHRHRSSSHHTHHSHNVHRTLQISPQTESFLGWGKRCDQGAACPSRHSSVVVIQVPLSRRHNHSHHLPQTRHRRTVTACSRRRPVAAYHLAHAQSSLHSDVNHRPTETCMGATHQGRKATDFLRDRLHGLIATMVLLSSVGSRYLQLPSPTSRWAI